MNMSEYVDEIKLKLTGGVFDLELTDGVLAKTVNSALREIQRYIDTTKLIKVPFAECIDLKDFKCSSITAIYRTEGYLGDSGKGIEGGRVDPIQAQMWMAFANGGSMYNLQNYVLNIGSYNTLLQMRNTISTDLSFKYDKREEKLYINTSGDHPDYIAIEFVPVYDNVEEITDDYWIDILMRLSLSLVKQILGKVRSRYKQSNALWTQDGDEMLAEGREEAEALREQLRVNSTMFYPID